MDIQVITLLHDEAQHVRLVELSGKVHGHVIVAKMGDLEVKKLLGNVVLSICYVLNIYIKELIPVVLDVLEVDWMAPFENA